MAKEDTGEIDFPQGTALQCFLPLLRPGYAGEPRPAGREGRPRILSPEMCACFRLREDFVL